MCIIRFKLKPALLSILLGISTAIYDNKGFSRVQPKGEISESNRVSQKNACLFHDEWICWAGRV